MSKFEIIAGANRFYTNNEQHARLAEKANVGAVVYYYGDGFKRKISLL